MRQVYYLCNNDDNNSNGLVFPNELNETTYAPGFWVIESKSISQLESSYSFNAVENNSLQTLTLKRVKDRFYTIKSKEYGSFGFIVERSFKIDYVGNSTLIDPMSNLYILTPLNVDKLNSLAKEKLFFFVGFVDESIVRQNYS